MRQTYGGAVALQVEGEDRVENENLIESFAAAANALRRNYATVLAMGVIDPTTAVLKITSEDGQIVFRWIAEEPEA